MNDWWDGPKTGVADYKGAPHIFNKNFNESLDDYDEYYLLTPITQEQCQLIIEGYEIWKRYRDASSEQQSPSIYGALPGEHERYVEINSLTNYLFEPLRFTFKVKASFRPLPTKSSLPFGLINYHEFDVNWLD
ncbi:hypothetical protein [Paenibacillus sp. sgz5001063]|uniref:hypothetical protein n=1 Tax=Paenibacillus sp. sgz5001063 TaxID=3242474 RepID=UPI0036D3409C